MARRVFFHVGLPKTGTTYVQSVLWANRKALAEQGVLFPGGPREHLWASLSVRERPGLAQRNPEAEGAWDRVVEALAAWDGDALVSHEFLGSASAEQAQRAVAAVAPAEAHVIVTARDLLTVLSSYWQEYVKHGFESTLDEFPVSRESGDEWGWEALDLAGVLRRWGGDLPPERVHLLVLPERDAPRETLVLQFAELLGADASGFSFDRARENTSLGLVEAELLRRVSPHLSGFGSALDRGVWIRGYLAHRILVPREGERFLPSDARVAELARLADEGIAEIQRSSYDVVGDLERLRVTVAPGSLRHPDDVSPDELFEASLDTIAKLMQEMRVVRRNNSTLKKSLKDAERALEEATAEDPEPESRWSRALDKVRRAGGGPDPETR
ncbi:hypothetical protein [Nocardioides sp.]|uniref:hypothetical protein n=1 Tax=Nocardioides sp. TaxID=35761 RepID=UPI003528A929